MKNLWAPAIGALLAAAMLVGCSPAADEDAYLRAVIDEWSSAAMRIMAPFGNRGSEATPAALGWTDEKLLDAGYAMCDGMTPSNLTAEHRNLGMMSAEIIARNARTHLCPS